jgi:hemerythrin superfamily protein
MKDSSDTQDAISLLKEQHREVESLFEQIEHASDNEDKEILFQELADNLAAHAQIEEKVFYPAAYARPTKKLLLEAVEEHLAVKRIVADLLEMSPKDEHFEAKIKVLKEQVEHHVEEEENELFPKVQKELDAEQLKTLGAMMEEMFEAALDDDPSEKIPAETAEAARIR